MKTARSLIAALTVTCLMAPVALAQPGKDKPKAEAPKAPAQPDKAAAPGMPSDADMKAMMELYMKAAQPGEMHKHLAKGVGTWDGKVKMWHVPGMPPQESACTTVISSVFEGRFTKCETNGEMPGMGPFTGFGLYGFDNVSQKFQSIWIDNMGTGMMIGTGELSPDGKTMTWNMTFNDPATGKPCVMREVERYNADGTMTLEMHGPGPDGKEFKMMEIAYTKAAGGKAPGKAPAHSEAADHSKAVDHTTAAEPPKGKGDDKGKKK